MRSWITVVLPLMLTALVSPALAAPNFVGQSGNLVTPDDRVLPSREFSIGYHYLDKRIFGRGDNLNIFSVGYGFTPQLEAGLAYVDNGSGDLVVNAKYQILRERSNAPSLTVGVVDLFDQLNRDPGAYLLLGKNLTAASRDVRTEAQGRLVHGYIGLGTGTYEGLIVGLSFVANPQLTLMAEYSPEGPLTGRDDTFNVGLRYAIRNRIRLDAGLFDFDNFGVGVSFTSGFSR
jgi:hypothetical protein